ncbi:MAG: glycosyltransferase family 4 protein [Rudanella sp.]|nr:glycosyltransferase family 4 protein [Rudanella sp.]
MHILLIHPYFLPPGAAGSIRWNEIARHCVSAGHRVTVLAGSVDYLTGKQYETTGKQIDTESLESGIRVIRVPMSSRYDRGRWGRLWAYWTFFWNSLWAGLVNVVNDVDIVLATSPPLTAGMTGLLLAQLRRRPLVLEIRDLWPDAPVQMGYLSNPVLVRMAFGLERILYQQAAHIVTLTPAFENVLMSTKNIPPSRCTTISNGADNELTDTALVGFDRSHFREENYLNNHFWIIYAGAHGPANGLCAVLDAAETVQDQPVGFLLIGDGSQKAHLQAQATRRGLTNIRFLPAMPKPDVLRWIAAADAGLVIMQPLPIFQTMLSAKLFDYIACGKPVLTAIDGLTRQLAEQHGFGLFLDPMNPTSWYKQICLYIARPTLISEHGNNGLTYARKTANRTLLAHRYLTILNRVYFSDETGP